MKPNRFGFPIEKIIDRAFETTASLPLPVYGLTVEDCLEMRKALNNL